MTGDIMRISRLRMGTDGKGVSTLVTFFGCPLHCKYCINDFCHEENAGYIQVLRGAYTPEQLVSVLRKDDIYYRMSGGGVVFGGGEPLLQPEFIHEVCKLADSAWKMRVETSLNVPWRSVELLIHDIDEWIIDIKDMNGQIYEAYTGVNNRSVIDNLLILKELTAPSMLHIRVPRIPRINDEKNIEESVKWIRDTLGVEPEVFAYYPTTHRYCDTITELRGEN